MQRMPSSRFLALLLLPCALASLAGCGGEPAEDELGESTLAVKARNGRPVNGRPVNGRPVNGPSFSGGELESVPVSTFRTALGPVSSVALRGTRLTGRVTVSGTSRLLEDFTGVRMIGKFRTSWASPTSTLVDVPLRIQRVVTSGLDAAVTLYEVEYEVAGTGGFGTWMPLCDTDVHGRANRAIAVAGTWDLRNGKKTATTGALTLSCTRGAVGKCVESVPGTGFVGYKPWTTRTECRTSLLGTRECRTVPLSDHHQACVRMMRADYCGDGQPMTTDGRQIDVSDSLSGGNADTASWGVEATWSPSGATCVNDPRRTGWLSTSMGTRLVWDPVTHTFRTEVGVLALTLDYLNRTCPSRVAPLDRDCPSAVTTLQPGVLWSSARALLRTEASPSL